MKASLGDIKENTFLGSAAMPQTDGTQKALEVHIFPEQMRGTGEGHRPYAPVPNSTMTNGTASGATVTGVEASTVTVKYKDGPARLLSKHCAPMGKTVKARTPWSGSAWPLSARISAMALPCSA